MIDDLKIKIPLFHEKKLFLIKIFASSKLGFSTNLFISLDLFFSESFYMTRYSRNRFQDKSVLYLKILIYPVFASAMPISKEE